MDTNNNIIDIIEISRYRDGGTSVWVSVKDKYESLASSIVLICKKYYIDNRISSTTKGELYDRYPSDEGAKILDKSNYNFVTKEQIERDKKIDEICHYSGLLNVSQYQ